MSVHADTSLAFTAADDFTSVESFAVSSVAVETGARRLEGAFYGSDGYRAVQRMKRSGFRHGQVGDMATVLWFGPFGRNYVENPDAGVSFLSSSEMMEARPHPKNYISKALTRNLARLIVREGTILVSCSGSIGNVVICTSDLDGSAVSQHAIRVVPNLDLNRGLLYAFLQSDVGQFLLTRSKSGSVVESLYEADISGLPIPLLPKALRDEMTRLLDESSDLRVRANELLARAEVEIEHVCFLEGAELKASPSSRPSTFTTRASDISERLLGPGDIRLDATRYLPSAASVRTMLLNHPMGRQLGDVSIEIHRVAPGKRTYVDDPKHGLALLGGKQMMQWRPRDVRYLSKRLTVSNATETVPVGRSVAFS